MMKKIALKLSRKSKKKGVREDLDPENSIICYACEGTGLSRESVKRSSAISCANRLRVKKHLYCEICDGNKRVPIDKT